MGASQKPELNLPRKATKENITSLIKLGSSILEMKSSWRRFLYKQREVNEAFAILVIYYGSLVFSEISLLLIFIAIGYVEVPISQYPPHILWFFVIYEISMLIVSICLGFLRRKRFYNWVIYKVLKLTKPEYEVFNSFSALAKGIVSGNRREALKQLKSLSKSVSRYTEANHELKTYLLPEASVFTDSVSLGRLILYSKKSDTDLACEFLDFAILLVNQEFSAFHSKVQKLSACLSKFKTKPYSRFEKLVNFLEMTENIKNLLFIIIALISFMLWITYGLKFSLPFS